jgi:type II secretory pathway predicted ATPase ExeA
MDTILDINAELAAMELQKFQRFFPFRSHPFAARVDGAKAMLLGEQTAARDKIRAALEDGVRVVVFVGPSGLGKSIIIDNAISVIHDKYQPIKLDASSLAAPADLPRLIGQIDKNTKFVRFFVDDAHDISRGMLIEFRNFLNLLESEGISSQVVLVGKQQVVDLFADAFAGLSTVTINMTPMDYETLHAYMASRLNLAGLSSTQVMTSGAIQTLIRASNGSLGRLNALATHSFRNAVDLRHTKVQPGDASLAVSKPGVLPSNAYSWTRRHPKTSIVLMASVACAAFISYGVGKPWFHDAREATVGNLQYGISSVIDLFSDHSSEESPQVVADDDAGSRQVDPIFLKRTEDENKRAAAARAKLLAKMDQEVRGTVPTGNDVQSKAASEPAQAPQVPAGQDTGQEQPANVVAEQPEHKAANTMVVASKGANDTLLAATAPPIVARPVAPEPIIGGPVAAGQETNEDIPLPPPAPPAQTKTAPAAHKAHENKLAAASAERAATTRAGKLPEFCTRMHPDTEAGKAYMRQVCVPQNVRGDIYFHVH